MGGGCCTYSGEESAYRVLVWNRSLVGPRRIWEDNINMGFKVIM